MQTFLNILKNWKFCEIPTNLRIFKGFYIKYVGKRKSRNDPFSAYAKFSERLPYYTAWYAHVHLRILGSGMLVFREILLNY